MDGGIDGNRVTGEVEREKPYKKRKKPVSVFGGIEITVSRIPCPPRRSIDPIIKLFPRSTGIDGGRKIQSLIGV